MQFSQSTKTDYCFYCYLPITAPINQSIVKCSNLKCKKINVFLCHIVNPTQKLNDIVCLKCSTNLILLTCQNCSGFQAWNKTNDNFKNGMKRQCACGSISTLIYCNSCQALLSIKGKKSHQLSTLKCKNCQNQFRYKLCEECKILIYKEKWDTNNLFICPNGNCANSDIKNPYDLGNQLYANRLTQFEKQNVKQIGKSTKTKIQQKQLCKICFNQQANTINTKCYHLAVCQKCAQDLKKQCPICRSQGGEFKKVFKV